MSDRGGRRMLLAGVFGVAAVCLLSGCTGFKQAIGLEAQPPDEFAVEARAPLTIPPEFDLRPPTPGAARPQEASAAAKAQQAVNAAGPGKPGDEANAPHLGGAFGSGPDPNQQVGPGSLAGKLLTSNDVEGGARLDNRATSTLQGVY